MPAVPPVPATPEASPAADVGSTAFSARDFRDAMGQFATGVVVLSIELDGHAHAMTANAFMSGSLKPPLVLVSVARTARMHGKIARAGRFGISVLTQAQQAHSHHFAGQPVPGFEPRFERVLDVLVLDLAVVRLVAELRHVYDCGDHTLFVGEVRWLHRDTDLMPLMFHGGRYVGLAPADGGAETEAGGFWASADRPLY